MDTQLFAIALLTMSSLGTAQAAEKIRFDQIPDRIGPLGSEIQSRSITITTIDGVAHHGTSISYGANFAALGGRVFPSATVARIGISRRGRFYHHTKELFSFATAVCGLADVPTSWGCVTSSVVLFSPVLAAGVVSAPSISPARRKELLVYVSCGDSSLAAP